MRRRFVYILVLLATMLFFVDCVNAKDVPGAISVDAGLNGKNLSYINSVSFRVKKSSSGNYVYCLNRHKNTYAVENFFVAQKLDAGFKYLIENGFPNTSITGDSNKDYYITQIAIWLYQDRTGQYVEYNGNKSNLDVDFIVKNNNSNDDSEHLMKNIIVLLEGAINARNSSKECTNDVIGVGNYNIELKKSGDYYVSDAVSVKASGSYTVEFVGSIKGAVITDSNGLEKTTFSKNDKFVIKVPTNVTFKAFSVIIKSTAKCSNSSFVYEYRSKVSDHQNILPAVIYDSGDASVNSSAEIKFTINNLSSSDDKNDDHSKDDNNTNDDKKDDNSKNDCANGSNGSNDCNKDCENNGSAGCNKGCINSSCNCNNNCSGNSNNCSGSCSGNISCCNKDCANSSSNCNTCCVNNNCSNTNVSNNTSNSGSSNNSDDSIFIPNTAFDSPITLAVGGFLIVLFGLGFVYFNAKKKD